MRGLLNKIKALLAGKSIKNGLWLYLLQIFNTVIPLLTLPYITRILGAAEYGVFSIALNIIGYYQVVVEYGFGMSATRKVALLDGQSPDKIFSAVLAARSILVFTCMAFSTVYCVINLAEPTQCLSLLILSVCLLGYCVQQNWLFQGKQDMKYISIASIVARTLSVILIFLLVKTEADLLLYCLLYALSPVVSGFLGLLLAKHKYRIHFVQVSLAEIWEELKNGWYVFTTQLSSKVFGAIGITFLGIFATNAEVGIYSAIQKIPNTMMLVWAPISQVLYPISSKRMQESYSGGKQFVGKMRRIFLPLAVLAVLVIGLFSKRIVTLVFGAEYTLYYYWILPLLAWMVVSINNNFWGIQILLGSGHDKQYSKCFQLGVACTILFNLIFIWCFGGTGAAFAPLLSELVLGAALWYQIKKLDKQL